MPGQIQSPAGLVRVEKPDDVQAEVSLEPLDVGVGTMKHLRAGEEQQENDAERTRHRAETAFGIFWLFSQITQMLIPTRHACSKISYSVAITAPPQKTMPQAEFNILMNSVNITHNADFFMS